MRRYKDLIVWQKAMDLVVAVYELAKDFPKEELYGIVAQIKRSAISIPSNIAEGRRRGSKKEYRQFLLIAFGSGAELETQIEIAKRLSFGKIEKYPPAENLLSEIMKILNKLSSKLKN